MVAEQAVDAVVDHRSPSPSSALSAAFALAETTHLRDAVDAVPGSTMIFPWPTSCLSRASATCLSHLVWSRISVLVRDVSQ